MRRLALLLALACVAPARADDAARLTLDRLFASGEFHADGLGPARWRPDGAAYTVLEADGDGRAIVEREPDTGRSETILPARRLVPEGRKEPLSIADYAFSADRNKVLIFTNTRRVWRLNTRGDYWVIDLKADDAPPRKLGGDAPEATLQFAKFDPSGSRVAYVRENNLYVEDLASGRVTRLTDDGSPTRFNGTFDWVYEEEWSLRDGFRWSPDGERLAYWQVDDDGVGTFFLINNTDDLYSKPVPIPYPKVGQTNPICRVGVVGADGGPTTWLGVPGDPRDHYITKMDWAERPDEVALVQVNRLQNEAKVMLAEADTGDVRTVLTERDDAWVDINDGPRWISDGARFAWLSERDGWRQLYLAPRDGGTPRPVTGGAYDVIELLRVGDTSADFLASPVHPTRRYLYRVDFADGKARKLTPDDQPGTHSYQISPDGQWAFHTRSAFGEPPTIELVSLPDHEVARTLVDNEELRSKLAALDRGPSEFFRVDIGEGVALDGWCMRPPGFDPSKKYPLLIHVYGEPAGQTVLDQWGGHNYLWHLMLTQRGYVVASVDNRGTPAPRGRRWRKSIYRQIGILASKDQAAALLAMEAKWPFVDEDRVGIWGWSGGGSMSLNMIFRYPDLYRTAVAVAPVADQRLYDTIYQERYMGLPRDNPDGFRDGSPLTFADRLAGNLLLIHGTGDDNCHYQATERLVNRLIEANKPFTLMAYPNRTHAIAEGPNTTRHLYGLMTDYLLRNLPAGDQ